MGGGASVHKRRDNSSDSSNDASARGGGSSSSQKQSKSTGFKIRRRKQKESLQTSALRRSQQGSMGKLERGEFRIYLIPTTPLAICIIYFLKHITNITAHSLTPTRPNTLNKKINKQCTRHSIVVSHYGQMEKDITEQGAYFPPDTQFEPFPSSCLKKTNFIHFLCH